MKQGFKSNHFNDRNGNPAGGTTSGKGFTIGWQNGPLREQGQPGLAEPNGAFVEDIIGAAIDRLEYYQKSRFACDYNENAIKCLNEALSHCEARTADRESRNVEGTHQE